MTRSKSQRNRDRISRRLSESSSAETALELLTPEVMLTLKRLPHPKLKASALSALDYTIWLAEHCYSTKVKAAVEDLQCLLPIGAATESELSLFETYVHGLRLRVKEEDYGVPKTYR